MKPEPRAGGGRGAVGPSWPQPAPFEEASALATAEYQIGVPGGERWSAGLRRRAGSLGLSRADSGNGGRGRVFRDSGPRRSGVTRGWGEAGRWLGAQGRQKEGRALGELWGWDSLKSWNNARGVKRLRSGIPGYAGRGGSFEKPRREEGTGREGGMVLPPPTPAAQPPGRGAAPALPLPRTIQAGPGPAGLGPRTPPLPPAPSPVPPAPAASGGEVGAEPTRPQTSCKFTPTPPASSTPSSPAGKAHARSGPSRLVT